MVRRSLPYIYRVANAHSIVAIKLIGLIPELFSLYVSS